MATAASPPGPADSVTVPVPAVVYIEQTFQGRNILWWAAKTVRARKEANALKAEVKRLRARLARHLQASSPSAAICRVFGPYCAQAIRVASCESHLYTGARNGQYQGMFQMGDYARARYGHGSDALTQARAAYAYFVASGRDWSPWECKP